MLGPLAFILLRWMELLHLFQLQLTKGHTHNTVNVNPTAGLLDSLKLQKVDVLGFSMGSFIAQQLTLTHPEKVNRLILYGAACGGKEGISPSPEVVKLGKKLTNNIVNNTPIEPQEFKAALSITLGPTWLKLHPNYTETIPTNPKDLLSEITPNAFMQQYNAVLSWYSSN